MNTTSHPTLTYEYILGLFEQTGQQLKELTKERALASQETDRVLKETDRMLKEFAKERAIKLQETEKELKELAKERAIKLQEAEEELKELERKRAIKLQETKELEEKRAIESQEAARVLEELKKESVLSSQEAAQMLKELGKQIGGLGEKFGSFTEGLALPSMTKILQERFGMEVIMPSVRVRKGGEHLEIDVLAYTDSHTNEIYVVEVKSHPRPESIDQLRNLLKRFRLFFPQHKDKKLYGILTGVDYSADVREQTLAAGFYVAGIHDNVFELQSPEGFIPKPC